MNFPNFIPLISTNVRMISKEDIMSNSDRIIEEYLKADLEKRLSLFLDCPALRNEFIEIDFSEYQPATRVKKNEGTVLERSFPSRWLTAVASCCLKSRRP